MASPLVIVESQAKAETLAAQFESNAEFLVVSSSPMKISFADEEGDATSGRTSFNFSPLPQEKALIEALQAGKEREVYVALAHDQQGQYWAWMIDGYFSKLTNGANTVRSLQMVGLQQDDLTSALKEAGPVDSAAGAACYSRLLFHTAFVGHVGRLLGTAVGPGNFPVTYNSLTVIFLLVEREEEIKTYSPALKWQVHVDLLGPGGAAFRADLIKAPGSNEDGFFKDASQGKEAVKKFHELLFEVNAIDREKISIQPPAPFRLCDLLGDAAVRFKMSPKNVLAAVRQLFYGVKVNGVLTGLITSFYPQAEGSLDSLKVKLKEQVQKEYGADAVADDDESLTDFAGLLLPLSPSLTEKELAGQLSEDTLKVYILIRNRALASHMVSAEIETIDVELTAGPESRFLSSDRTLAEQGFMAVYQELADRDLSGSCVLNQLKVGQTVSLDKIIPEQTRGVPPEYYTFDSLFDELADFSIELDPSAVSMLQAMLDNAYLSIGGMGELRAGDNAFKVAMALYRVFPSMRGISLSAYLEQTIEEAVSGRKGLGFAMRQFHQTLTMQGKALVKEGGDIASRLKSRKQTSSRIIATPQDVAPVDAGSATPRGIAEAPAVEVESLTAEARAADDVVQDVVSEETVAAGQLGDFADKEIFEEEIPEVAMPFSSQSSAEEASLAADEAAVISEIFDESQAADNELSAADGKAFDVPLAAGTSDEAKSTGMQCPVCRKNFIIKKMTPTGREFYVCPAQDCEFIAWEKPHAIPCQVCHSPFLVEKRNVRGQSLLRCPRAGCNYMEPLDGEEIDTSSPVEGKKKLVRRVARKGGKATSGKKRVVVRRK